MNHVDFHKIRVTSCLHGMYMSRISSQEMEETKPDGFDVTSTNVHMDLLQREVGVFDEMSGRLHLHQMLVTRHQDICGNRTGCFFEKMSGHFPGVFVLAKTRHVGAFTDLFMVTKPGICDETENHSRCICCRQNQMLFMRHLDNSRPVCR